MFFKHFASKNQLPGFSTSGTLVENGLRYLNFCPHFICHVGKRLDKKAKVYFKYYDVTDWTTNNYCLITQDVKQPDNEAWSVNGI